jgi:hypothetical protein
MELKVFEKTKLYFKWRDRIFSSEKYSKKRFWYLLRILSLIFVFLRNNSYIFFKIYLDDSAWKPHVLQDINAINLLLNHSFEKFIKPYLDRNIRITFGFWWTENYFFL